MSSANFVPDPLPPFCTPGVDFMPTGPVPGSAESIALAAWEVLTRARIARSAGSGRMSLLGRYQREHPPLTRHRMVWIALHAFEGADERWACRRAVTPSITDEDLLDAVVQEMGGPAPDPEEMTTLGFWQGGIGFYFDCRDAVIRVTEPAPSSAGTSRQVVTSRIGSGHLLATGRRLLGLDRAGRDGHAVGADPATPRANDAGQLRLF